MHSLPGLESLPSQKSLTSGITVLPTFTDPQAAAYFQTSFLDTKLS